MKDEELKKAAEAEYPYFKKGFVSDGTVRSANHVIDGEREAFIKGAEWQEAQGWISVETRMPERDSINKNTSETVIFSNGVDFHKGWYDFTNGKWYVDGYVSVDIEFDDLVTHWHPLFYPPINKTINDDKNN